MGRGVRLEPLLEAISKFLDRQHAMIERVRCDLVRGLKKPRQGRRGLTAPQVLRSLVLMRVKNWDYRELRERIADSSLQSLVSGVPHFFRPPWFYAVLS